MQSFRRTLVANDPYRNWTLAWNRLGLPSEKFILQTGDDRKDEMAEAYPARNPNAFGITRLLGLPLGIQAGGAKIVGADDSEMAVDILEFKPKHETVISPGTGAADVAAALANGDRVILLPGLYFWEQAVYLPPFAEVLGYGARIIRIANGDYGERLFVGGENATIRGVTFEAAWLTFHSNPVVTGLVCVDCVFRTGLLGYGYTECLFQDCVFEGCSVTIAPFGLYLRPRFLRNNFGNAFGLWGPCAGEFAMIDAEFDGTDRGPTFNTNNGPVTDNLIVGLSCRNMTRDNNGNEMVMAEGTHEYSRNMHIHTRATNCDGHLYQMDAPAHDNGFYDTVQEGGGGLWLMGNDDHPQTGNVFDGFELRGGGITIGWEDATGRIYGANTTQNVFRNGAVINHRPTRLNQGRYDPSFYKVRSPVRALHPTAGMLNTIQNVDVVGVPFDAPNGVNAIDNIASISVRVDGAKVPDTVPTPVPEPAAIQ